MKKKNRARNNFQKLKIQLLKSKIQLKESKKKSKKVLQNRDIKRHGNGKRQTESRGRSSQEPSQPG